MKNVRSKSIYVLLLIGIFILPRSVAVARAENNQSTKKSLKVGSVMTATYPSETVIDINNITSWLRGDGYHDPIVTSSWNGTFPKGTAGFIYAEGIVWGGKVNDGLSPTVRVAGNVYASSCRAGKIITDSSGNVIGREPDDPINNRIFRVRRDWATADLTDDAANFYLVAGSAVSDQQKQNSRDQYLVDWVKWPAAKGAPYEDRNHNGIYDPDPNGRVQSTNGDTLFDIPGQPGADQTMWIVYNDLDPGTAESDYGSPPIGLEVQETDWAYNSTNPFGNMIFKKSRIIYKGTTATPHNATIDSMFIVQWADPDDGQYSDDFAGCDTTLSLGYVYNSTSVDAIYFNQFGLAPPAGGFTFLQGPIVPGAPTDSAIFNLNVRYGFKNLPMTTFTYFAAGSSREDPDRGGSYSGTLQWYDMMRGCEPRPQYPNCTPLFDQNESVTHFELSGDPVAGTGDLDGHPTTANPNRLPAGDRRIVLSSGPFTMLRGDTQEVVTALVGGLGKDYLSSVTILKYNVTFAHFAYNHLFNLPSPPPSPVVSTGQFDKAIVLSWGDDPVSINNIENSNIGGFTFWGYNVYQFPPTSNSLQDAVKIISYYNPAVSPAVILDQELDPTTGVLVTVPVQAGTHPGIDRTLRITKDYIRNEPLVDGQSYKFAVTAVSYSNLPGVPFKALESNPVVKSVVPHSPDPGVRYHATSGDTIPAVHVSGTSDGSVLPVVIDPSKLNGDVYKVTFSVDSTSGNTVWALTDSTKDTILLKNQTNQSGDNNYSFVNGVEVKVQGPSPGMKDWTIPSGTRRWTFAGANFGLEGFSGAMGMGYYNWFSSSSVTPDKLHNVLLKLAATDVNGNLLDPNDTTASYAYRYLRHATLAPVQPSFAPYIVNPDTGYAYQDYKRDLPFAAYDEETGQRLMVGFLENNAVNGTVDGKYWPPDGTATSADNVGSDSPKEWFFIFNVPYSSTANPVLQADILDVTLPIMWMGTPARRGNVAFAAGDEFQILANHVNGPADVFRYVTPAPTSSSSLAQTDVERINVFPNPYYGYNNRELTRIGKYVTFNHLPPTATIRIFNLAGVLVKIIDHTNQTQFDTWNLRNQSQLPVASGIYIVYIDMPTLNTTKILKLALIQEEQILRVY
jgi:hypothetical protein